MYAARDASLCLREKIIKYITGTRTKNIKKLTKSRDAAAKKSRYKRSRDK